MSETNGRVGRSVKGEAARRIMGEIGEGCTYDELCDRLANESNTGGTVAEATYYQIRRELWPHLHRPRKGTPAVIPDRPPAEPEPKPARDWLTRLVRFGVAVEDVGGVECARRMLDTLGELEGRFGRAME